jgi:phospholipase/carboxylesterase
VSGLDGLEYRLRLPAGEPEGALVLMHGRGTGSDDMYPLLDVFDPKRRLAGLAPEGPLTFPPGGSHWYGVRRVGYPDPETFRSTLARLEAWLDALSPELEIPTDRTVVGGFSQGAVMAYAIGLGAGRPAPAGILALSGFVPTVEGFELDLERRAGFPVAIAHGTHDQIIDVEWGRRARDLLAAAEADVTYRESPVGHILDPRELPTFTAWVRRTLAPALA